MYSDCVLWKRKHIDHLLRYVRSPSFGKKTDQTKLRSPSPVYSDCVLGIQT